MEAEINVHTYAIIAILYSVNYSHIRFQRRTWCFDLCITLHANAEYNKFWKIYKISLLYLIS